MKRKISFLTVVIMLCSLLAVGCNRVPTAQELVDNAFSSMSQGNANLTLEMLLEMSAEADLFGESVTMKVNMDIDADVQATQDMSYVSGEVAMEMFGMEINQPMESYTDMTEGYTYTLSQDVWYKQPVVTSSVSQPSEEELEEVRAESYVDLVLVEDDNEESTEWVVTGTLDYTKLMEVFGEDMINSLETGMDTEALSDLQLQVEMTFDKETEALKTMKCTCDEENLAKFEMDSGAIDTFEFFVTFHDATDLVIEIPAEVKENAIEGSASDVSLDL